MLVEVQEKLNAQYRNTYCWLGLYSKGLASSRARSVMRSFRACIICFQAVLSVSEELGVFASTSSRAASTVLEDMSFGFYGSVDVV